MASPRLVAMTADLPEFAVNALFQYGATSHVVVANHWDSPEELVAELGLQAPTCDLETVWRWAEALCAGRLREVFNAPIPAATPQPTSTAKTVNL